MTGKFECFDVFLDTVVVHDGDSGVFVEGIIKCFEHHEVVLGYLVEIVFPHEALGADTVAQGFVIDDVFEEFEGELLVAVESLLGGEVFGIVGQFGKGCVGLPEHFVVVDSSPVYVALVAVVLEVVVGG